MSFRVRIPALVAAAMLAATTASADIVMNYLDRVNTVRITACDEPRVIDTESEASSESGRFASDLAATELTTAHARQVSTVEINGDRISITGSIAAFVDREEFGDCEDAWAESVLEITFTPAVDSVMILTDTVRSESISNSNAWLVLRNIHDDYATVFTLPAAMYNGMIPLDAGTHYYLEIHVIDHVTVDHPIHVAGGCVFDVEIKSAASPTEGVTWSSLRADFR